MGLTENPLAPGDLIADVPNVGGCSEPTLAVYADLSPKGVRGVRIEMEPVAPPPGAVPPATSFVIDSEERLRLLISALLDGVNWIKGRGIAAGVPNFPADARPLVQEVVEELNRHGRKARAAAGTAGWATLTFDDHPELSFTVAIGDEFDVGWSMHEATGEDDEVVAEVPSRVSELPVWSAPLLVALAIIGELEARQS